MLGNNLGISMVPLNSLKIVIPAVTMTNTIARPTERADVYLNESAIKRYNKFPVENFYGHKWETKERLNERRNFSTKFVLMLYPVSWHFSLCLALNIFWP